MWWGGLEEKLGRAAWGHPLGSPVNTGQGKERDTSTSSRRQSTHHTTPGHGSCFSTSHPTGLQQLNSESDFIISTILHTRKLRHREAKQLAQEHTLVKEEPRLRPQAAQPSRELNKWEGTIGEQ